jgi:hypothetical protein
MNWKPVYGNLLAGAFGILLIIISAFGLSGCSVTNGSSLDAAFDRLEKGAIAVSCRVARTAAIAAAVQDAVDAGAAVKNANGLVYVASAVVCARLGGKLQDDVKVVQ